MEPGWLWPQCPPDVARSGRCPSEPACKHLSPGPNALETYRIHRMRAVASAPAEGRIRDACNLKVGHSPDVRNGLPRSCDVIPTSPTNLGVYDVLTVERYASIIAWVGGCREAAIVDDDDLHAPER